MAGNLLAIRAFLWYTADGQLKNGRCAGERKQHPAAEWGEKPRERVTVMPARLRQAKSDTYVPEPVGFAIPEAKMRSAAHGHLGRAFFCLRRVFGRNGKRRMRQDAGRLRGSEDFS